MKILVIDDEPLVRKAIKRVSEDRGHLVLVAENGEEALPLWEDFNPDLVFLDVLMPGLTGPQVLAQAPKKNATVVILMSAFSGDYDMEKAQKIGADLFIAKPFKNIFDVVDQGIELVVQKLKGLS